MDEINWIKAGKKARFKVYPKGSVFTRELSDGEIFVTCGRGVYEEYVEVSEQNLDGRTGCAERNLHNRGWALTVGRNYIATKTVKTQDEAERALRDIVDFFETHRGD